MPGKKILKFTLRDYITLGVAFLLAFAVWLIHNLSQEYSEVVRCRIVAVSDMDAHAGVSDNSAGLAARCSMDGFGILYYRLFPNNEVEVKFSRNELRHISGTRFCVPSTELHSHTHEIFGDAARCEYFLTDTLFFDFQEVAFKKLPVVSVWQVEYAPQYMACGPITLSPDSVIVYGPDERLERIQQISTRPTALYALSGDAAGELQLEIPEGMRLNTSVVEYHIPVSRYVEETVTVPVIMTDVPSGKNVVMSPSEAQVTLRRIFPGEQPDIKDMKVTVGYDNFEKSISGRCMGDLRGVPEGVLSAHVHPEFFDCVEGSNE